MYIQQNYNFDLTKKKDRKRKLDRDGSHFLIAGAPFHGLECLLDLLEVPESSGELTRCFLGRRNRRIDVLENVHLQKKNILNNFYNFYPGKNMDASTLIFSLPSISDACGIEELKSLFWQ